MWYAGPGSLPPAFEGHPCCAGTWECPKAGVDISSQQCLFQWLWNPAELRVLSVLRTQCGHGLLLRSSCRRWPQKGTQQQSSPEDRSCGAQVSLHWVSSPQPLPHGGELHKAILLHGCLWAEITSPLNREKAYKVGVRGEGSQNMINWYSLLSNYAAALPGAHTDGWRLIFCLQAGVHGGCSRLSHMGHGLVGTGSSGTSLFFYYFGCFGWG